MALTLKEITDQIDSFLHEVPQKYKEQFEKIIFSELQDCINIIIDLTHTELTIEALQLRVLRIGMDLEQNNKGSIHVDLACLQDLSKVFSVNDIEDNIKHKIAYASIAYFLSRGCTAQETLENFALTKQVLQQGGRLPFAIIDADFIKIYYAFCLALSSCRAKNITVHAAYDDLPVQDRIGNSMFETRILSYAIRALSFLTSLNLEDQIGVIAAYSTISATGYERPQLCEPSYIEQVINFATNEVKQEMLKRNILASMLKYGNSDGDMRKAATEMMQVAFPEIAERSAKLEATKEAIKEAKAYIHNIEEELKRRLKEIETYYRAIEQQSIGNINSQIAQAKRDAHSRAFQNTLKQAGAIAAGCFVGPAACGALGVSAGIATTVTSAAIGGATQTAITGGDLGDILKSAAIAGVTAGVMSKVPVSTELTSAAKRIEGAKLAIINSAISTGASTIVQGKGKLDPVAMLSAGLAGASGVNMEGLTKDLTERAIKDTTATAIHGGKLVPNLLTGVIESTAGHFGKTMGEELKSNIEADRALSSPKLVLEPQSQQEKDDRIKTKGKDRLQEISPIAAEEQTIAPQDKKQTTDATAEHKEKRHGGCYQIKLEGLEEQILGGYQNTKETRLGSGFYDLDDPYPHNPSVLKKSLGTVLGGIGSVFVGTAHADELEQPNKDEASSSTSRFSVSSPKPRVNTSSSRLDQIQSFPAKSISDNDLAISPKQQQQLKSNPSWINSIISFPGDLLFGQMAYADGAPQSSGSASSSSAATQPTGIFNIFKSAVDGDPHAQLEMRRRVPMGATFSDAIGSSYRAWNDPILGFKNNVHNRLGVSWFLPGSMDDLGQVCLNVAASAAGAGSIPKVFDGGRKVQFAYQAYKSAQAVEAATSTANNRVTVLAEGFSKSSVKELISSGKLDLPKSQLDKIMSTVNKASRANSSITIKQVNTNGNIKVIVERPGYNGFQRFSSEINANGDRTIVVQTAYDKYGSIVQQKPGQVKNNIFDVKLYKPKTAPTFQPKPE